MTRPVASILAPAEPRSGTNRRAVTILSGFLGAGKTTLLRREHNRAGGRRPAVIVNEFANTDIDGVLLGAARPDPVMILGGCICCTRSDGLATALLEVLNAEQSGERAAAPHVIVETTGLADPAPIASTIANDPVLRHHFRLGPICIAVDALLGAGNIVDHDVALRQIRLADRVFITKSDLADPETVASLRNLIRQINPSAQIGVTGMGALVPDSGATWSVTDMHAREPGDCLPRSPHAQDYSTVEWIEDRPVDWQAFAIWLSMLLHAHGGDVLRVKGVIDIKGVGRVSINGVRHVMHEPEHLDTTSEPGTKIVFIVQNLDAQLLLRSLNLFQRLRKP